MTTTTLVLGAGGATGKKVVECLVAKKQSKVIFGVRSPDKHKDLIAKLGVDASRQDVSSVDTLDFTNIDKVVFCWAAAAAATYAGAHSVDYMGVVNCIDAAKKAGCVKHFVLISSRLVDPVNRWHPVRMILNTIKWNLMDNKFKGEQALLSSSIDYTIIRPGGLTDADAGAYIEACPAEGKLTATSICRSEVANVVVECLENEKAKGKIVELVSRERKDGEKGYEARLAEIF
mmetsp:Transcript_23950/g.45037  ORF Transcript_23950/g.45037 Transcript_23950/m.45037 type:complete len:232 (+) Transcript_23950:47-742(+)|eukprot:CAMPEP_0182492282 /NCGR_PEP_ID=MMETSP1321-20130603/1474_1 /TAXON_ID=91990 /ORGANISM="Bolidomonas sp., Strain RCC1657" /LENGTH=231 /DNA_ID=CAMNT_0024694735 /DNA_START=14 /DNA_END=706 /DNA_ORIENTATION=+